MDETARPLPGGKAASDGSPPELMNTREVAEYVRLKERKIYDLVGRGLIPCTRVSGKWLFPRREIDAWLAEASSGGRTGGQAARPVARPAPPPVIAGSHDPLLEWCASESGCGLALLGGGSLDGLDRLARGEALAAGVHVLDPETGEYNGAAVGHRLEGADAVAIEWAVREQGLVLPAGNPLGIRGLGDLVARGLRVARRQEGSGARILLAHLLGREGLPAEPFAEPERPARTEIEVGFAIVEGKADAGLAVRSVATRLRLDFLPLHRERFDLAMRRREYFGPEMQALLSFARTEATARRAEELGGYDLGGLGTVRYNAPL
jgi:excisionase family DNA binding protein